MNFIYSNQFGTYFRLSSDFSQLKSLTSKHSLIHIHWNRGDSIIYLRIDGIITALLPGQITTTTYLHQLEVESINPDLLTYSFNRSFYCIVDHDHEVSCNGILFFGTMNPPIISIPTEEIKSFDLLHEVFVDEGLNNRDSIQGEMLRMLLKRLIIKITRLAKLQLKVEEVSDSQLDIIRKYTVLVDMHFKEKRQVADYADLLNKSPKTLSNLFAKYNQKTPLQIIHERIILQAKRLLIYSDFSVKEIAHQVGFSDVGTFHKLFKRLTESTPQGFKEDHKNVVLLNKR